MVNDDSVRRIVMDAMVKAGIVELENDRHMIIHKDGREYLILITVFDTSHFNQKETKDE